MSGYVLTPRAEARLEEIFVYSRDRFGVDQALAYRNVLIARLRALAEGRHPHGRSCSVLVRGAAPEGLLYAREGGHFIVFVKSDEGIVVIDFIHQRRDLPTLIASLTADES